MANQEGNPLNSNESLNLMQTQMGSRSAKEDNEFCSKIVLSENDTFILSSSLASTKRNTKIPKRFSSYETYLGPSTKNAIPRSNESKLADEKSSSGNIEYQRSLKSLQHVRVEVNRLPEFHLEPWCLVHSLYKCHCKGRAQSGIKFDFANIINSKDRVIDSPRKKRDIFECDDDFYDEPPQKSRKESNSASDCKQSSARTTEFNWKERPRRSQHKLKKLRNECILAEGQYIDLLNERIELCRKFNQTLNKLRGTNEINKQHALKDIILLLNQADTNKTYPSTNTQLERHQSPLESNQNEVAIVPWDQILQALKSYTVFIWDVEVEDNIQLLVLTTTHTKPTNYNFIHITNINDVSDVKTLPLVALLLRNGCQAHKSSGNSISFLNKNFTYQILIIISFHFLNIEIAFLLLRNKSCWQICDVIQNHNLNDELSEKLHELMAIRERQEFLDMESTSKTAQQNFVYEN